MRIQEMHYKFDLWLDRVASNDRPDFMPWEKDDYINTAIWLFIKERYGIASQTVRGFETDEARIDQLKTLHIKSPELQPAITPINLGNGRYEFRLNSLGNNISGQYFRYLFLTDGVIKIRKDGCTKNIGLTQWQIDDDKTAFNASSWKWNRVLVNFGKSTFITPPAQSPVTADSPDVTASLITNYNLINERYNNDLLASIYVDSTNRNWVQEFEVVEACISYIKYPNRVFYGGYDHIDKQSVNTSEPIHCDLDEAFHDEIIRIAVHLAQGDVGDTTALQITQQRIQNDKMI